ncbi:MAG TPA: zf-HC2 domain-containing protein [Casimicrobiaceae bacterium]|nr:zf-HC2 domain-containing protein [Casimicrobiaceae bacterium]
MLLHRLTHMVSCKEASRLLSQREERRFSLGERVRLRLHLAACVACARFERQLALMRNAMSRYRQ